MSLHAPGGDPRFGPPAEPVATPGTTGAVGATDGTTGFAAPGRVYTAPGGPPPTRPAPPRAKGTPAWLVLTALGLVVVLAGGAFTIYRHQESQRSAQRAVFESTTVSVPEQVAGLQNGVGPGVESAQTRLNLALAKGGAINPVAASYIDDAGNSYALVVAARRVTLPEDLASTARSTAERFGTGIGSGTGSAIAMSSVAPGRLGGVMNCGTTTISDQPATLCVAVDQGSVAEFLVATANPAEAAGVATTLREAIVTRAA